MGAALCNGLHWRCATCRGARCRNGGTAPSGGELLAHTRFAASSRAHTASIWLVWRLEAAGCTRDAPRPAPPAAVAATATAAADRPTIGVACPTAKRQGAICSLHRTPPPVPPCSHPCPALTPARQTRAASPPTEAAGLEQPSWLRCCASSKSGWRRASQASAALVETCCCPGAGRAATRAAGAAHRPSLGFVEWAPGPTPRACCHEQPAPATPPVQRWRRWAARMCWLLWPWQPCAPSLRCSRCTSAAASCWSRSAACTAT